MKQIVSSMLIVSMLLSALPAAADDLPNPPAPVVSPVNKGQPAPYTGVLLSPEAVAQLVSDKDSAQKTLDLAVKHQVDLNVAQLKFNTDQLTTTCNADKKIMQAQLDDNMKQIKILDDQLKKQSSGLGAPTWIGVGVVGGVVLSVITVFAVSHASK